MPILEAQCTRCEQVFVPHGVSPEDLIHGETEEGTPCGGIGVILGSWGNDMPMVDFDKLLKEITAAEKHGEEHPYCRDLDCEFHHPEVRETAVEKPSGIYYYDPELDTMRPIVLPNDIC